MLEVHARQKNEHCTQGHSSFLLAFHPLSLNKIKQIHFNHSIYEGFVISLGIILVIQTPTANNLPPENKKKTSPPLHAHEGAQQSASDLDVVRDTWRCRASGVVQNADFIQQIVVQVC